MAFKGRLIFASVTAVFFLLLIWIGAGSFTWGLIFGIILFLGVLIVTSKSFKEWERDNKEKAMRERQRRQELYELQRNASAMEKGRLKGQDVYKQEKKAEEEHKRRVKKFLKNPFGI